MSLIVTELCRPGSARSPGQRDAQDAQSPAVADTCAGRGFGPSSPVREHLVDIRAILVDTVAEWAAVTGRPPARTPDGISEACERLVAHPYRYLSALGALEGARTK